MTDRSMALRVLAALHTTPISGEAVLVGSSGLFGFSTAVPALTEDIDISVPETTVNEHGAEIVTVLRAQGFEHEPGTATFVGAQGTVFDLLGHGDPREGDHIGGTGVLRVMVFEDISRIVGELGATVSLPGGGRALSPAGFVACKLLTERVHKGSKDKIQALLVLAEREKDALFLRDLARIFQGTDPVRLEDVRASAQDALLALARDPTFSDAGAEGYAGVLGDVERGLARLMTLLEGLGG